MSCGEKLNRNGKRQIPLWGFLLTIILCLVIGGGAYAFWDSFNKQQKPVTTQGNTLGDIGEKVEKDLALQERTPEEKTRVQLIEEVQQKVFTIQANGRLGSGFLYRNGGYIITNAHVVSGETSVVIRNKEGKEYAAAVIGISGNYDIALLKADAYADVDALLFETESSPVGSEVIAFGSPRGLENSASVGYITGQQRNVTNDPYIYKEIYQIDAQVDKGSSGGPLVDAESGKVIGINSILITTDTSTNFGFSIPLYTMLSQFDEWIRNPMAEREILAVTESVVSTPTTQEASVDKTNEVLAAAGAFVQSFRMYYEEALNNNNFYWIADMLVPQSSAYRELEKYVADMSYKGHYFDFIENNIQDSWIENGYIYVYTNEVFDFYSGTGKGDKHYNRYKTYEVKINQNGELKINKIMIHD